MSHLLWELTKNNNAFLVKRGGVQFTSDPYSINNRNLYSSSGLIHNYGVSITAEKKTAEKSNPVRYHLRFIKRKRWTQKVRKAGTNKKIVNQSHVYNPNVEHLPVTGVQKASQIIRRKFTHKRRDLARLALAKLYKLHRATQVKVASAAPKTAGKAQI